MEFQILEDDLSGPDIADLLRRHLEHAAAHSPPESIHALDLDRLRAPGITFWSVRSGDALVGCGALKELDSGHGEIKSMHTAREYRGQGVAARLLSHILDVAKARSYRRVSLETGTMDGFAPARALYARFGFRECAPFGSYREDPHSLCMTLELTSVRVAVDRFLEHLELPRETPSLDYLDRIIREHQRRVPFETLTKILDYEPGLARGDFMPPMEEYVDRIVTRGGGGLCWTLARGLHLLLTDLGFDASFMYMDPGHCCVRVDLSGSSYYADVGYAAPIYRAYPLFESFSLDTHREKFEYDVREDGIFVARNPGPSKRLDPTPRRLEDLRESIVAANDWTSPESFLHRLAYARDVDGIYTSVRDGILSRYLPAGVARVTLPPDEVPDALAGIFGADPALYVEAADVHRRYTSPRP